MGTVVPVLRVLRRPRWLAYLALALVFAVITSQLGLWQWHRRQFKEERRARVEAHYDGPVIPIGQVLPGPGTAFDPDLTWTRVSATGRYAPEHQLLVRNRPHDGVYGYEVLVPLRVDGGSVVVVDRGWVANARTAAELPEVPPAPGGEVEVQGWLRPGEPDLGRDLPSGQLASIDLGRAAAQIGAPVDQAYLVLEQEQPSVPRPAALERPDTSLGSHLAYAIQWWLSMPVGLVLVLMMARRQAEEEGLATSRASRPRKVRIWDEEDG